MDAERLLLKKSPAKSITLQLVAAAEWADFKKQLPKAQQNWAQAHGFEAAPLSLLSLSASDGSVSTVLVGMPRPDDDPFALGAIASKLAAGVYAFASAPVQPELVALGWCLELYKYDPHRPTTVKNVQLVCPKGVDHAAVVALANASYGVRDRVNTPANLFGPDELEAAARSVFRQSSKSSPEPCWKNNFP
jgi:leucyl aminopeptidase